MIPFRNCFPIGALLSRVRLGLGPNPSHQNNAAVECQNPPTGSTHDAEIGSANTAEDAPVFATAFEDANTASLEVGLQDSPPTATESASPPAIVAVLSDDIPVDDDVSVSGGAALVGEESSMDHVPVSVIDNSMDVSASSSDVGVYIPHGDAQASIGAPFPAVEDEDDRPSFKPDPFHRRDPDLRNRMDRFKKIQEQMQQDQSYGFHEIATEFHRGATDKDIARLHRFGTHRAILSVMARNLLSVGRLEPLDPGWVRVHGMNNGKGIMIELQLRNYRGRVVYNDWFVLSYLMHELAHNREDHSHWPLWKNEKWKNFFLQLLDEVMEEIKQCDFKWWKLLKKQRKLLGDLSFMDLEPENGEDQGEEEYQPEEEFVDYGSDWGSDGDDENGSESDDDTNGEGDDDDENGDESDDDTDGDDDGKGGGKIPKCKKKTFRRVEGHQDDVQPGGDSGNDGGSDGPSGPSTPVNDYGEDAVDPKKREKPQFFNGEDGGDGDDGGDENGHDENGDADKRDESDDDTDDDDDDDGGDDGKGRGKIPKCKKKTSGKTNAEGHQDGVQPHGGSSGGNDGGSGGSTGPSAHDNDSPFTSDNNNNISPFTPDNNNTSPFSPDNDILTLIHNDNDDPNDGNDGDDDDPRKKIRKPGDPPHGVPAQSGNGPSPMAPGGGCSIAPKSAAKCGAKAVAKSGAKAAAKSAAVSNTGCNSNTANNTSDDNTVSHNSSASASSSSEIAASTSEFAFPTVRPPIEEEVDTIPEISALSDEENDLQENAENGTVSEEQEVSGGQDSISGGQEEPEVESFTFVKEPLFPEEEPEEENQNKEEEHQEKEGQVFERERLINPNKKPLGKIWLPDLKFLQKIDRFAEEMDKPIREKFEPESEPLPSEPLPRPLLDIAEESGNSLQGEGGGLPEDNAEEQQNGDNMAEEPEEETHPDGNAEERLNMSD